MDESAFPNVTPQSWKKLVAEFQSPSPGRSLWQVANTLIPYVVLWGLMLWCSTISWWLVVPLVVLAAGFNVRLFIIFHDCGHGSFFKSQRANSILGFITGVLTLTPYQHWRWEHALHHSASGDLDRRGVGDIWTLTVREYLESSRWRRFGYRLNRNPFVLFVLAPLYLFLIHQRFPSKKARRRERMSVYWTNLACAGLFGTVGFLCGFKATLLIELLLVGIAGAAGVWLFYVQHQFEGVYWARKSEWNYTKAALEGSSFYKLPKILQWFSGSIGFHHIHHLSPAIPNYRLERCHNKVPLFQTVKPITLFEGFKSMTYRLWDEQRQKLVGYGALRKSRVRSR